MVSTDSQVETSISHFYHSYPAPIKTVTNHWNQSYPNKVIGLKFRVGAKVENRTDKGSDSKYQDQPSGLPLKRQWSYLRGFLPLLPIGETLASPLETVLTRPSASTKRKAF